MTEQKTVTIFRIGSFLTESQEGLDEYLAQSKQAVGGYWASANSKAIGTGLPPSVINLLLPELIDYAPEERDFKQKVREYFEGLETDVPYKSGAILDISLFDNSEKLSKENLPNNISDYVKYYHALGHPEVAKSRDLAQGNPLIRFYIHNPHEVKESNTTLRIQREDAMAAYLILSKDEVKVDNVLALYGEDPRAYLGLHEKLEELQKRTQSTNVDEVARFISIVGDKQLETKGLINKLVTTGVLRLVGTRYLIAQNNTILADDIEEAVLELQDVEKNSELLLVLKSQLQEQMKKKIAKKK